MFGKSLGLHKGFWNRKDTHRPLLGINIGFTLEQRFPLQEDAMALLSPTLYSRFILPLDKKMASEYPCAAFHLHGSALWAIDNLIQIPEIDVIELNMDDANCDFEGIFDGWKKIQSAKPLIIWRKQREGNLIVQDDHI